MSSPEEDLTIRRADAMDGNITPTAKHLREEDLTDSLASQEFQSGNYPDAQQVVLARPEQPPLIQARLRQSQKSAGGVVPRLLSAKPRPLTASSFDTNGNRSPERKFLERKRAEYIRDHPQYFKQARREPDLAVDEENSAAAADTRPPRKQRHRKLRKEEEEEQGSGFDDYEAVERYTRQKMARQRDARTSEPAYIPTQPPEAPSGHPAAAEGDHPQPHPWLEPLFSSRPYSEPSQMLRPAYAPTQPPSPTPHATASNNENEPLPHLFSSRPYSQPSHLPPRRQHLFRQRLAEISSAVTSTHYYPPGFPSAEQAHPLVPGADDGMQESASDGERGEEVMEEEEEEEGGPASAGGGEEEEEEEEEEGLEYETNEGGEGEFEGEDTGEGAKEG
ncbi:MAG: hypothetical protein Q9173_005264 [Seirophora scorigena]